MKIADGALVSLDVTMYDEQGALLEKSDEPLRYLHGHEDIFRASRRRSRARKSVRS